MKSKSSSLLVLAVLSLLVLTAFASATVTFSSQNPTTLLQTAGAHFLTISATSDVTEAVNLTANTITDSNGNKITISSITPVNPIPFVLSIPQTITVNYNVESDFDFFGKDYKITLTAKDSTTNAELGKVDMPFTQTSFCEWKNNPDQENDLTVTIRDITVTGFGEDNEWYPFDEVEVEVRVKNPTDKDVDNIELEWGLFNTKTGEWTIAVDNEKDFDLKDGDDNTLTLKFKIDNLEENFDELSTEDFILYARATGDMDSNTTCTSDSKDVKIITSDAFVVLNDIQVPETNSCGSEVQITADVWNMGDEDQDEVHVIIYNKELGINQKVVVGDINSFDSEKLDVTIALPSDVEEKSYTLEFFVYNEDDEIYENGNNDKSRFTKEIVLEGSCSTTPKILVSATLESEAAAGKELIVKAVIENTGSKTATLNLGLSNYEWASLVSIDKETLTLASGASEEVLIKLNINSGVSGDKNFDIVITEGDKIFTQPVAVSIGQSSLLPNITGWIAGIAGDNWYLWGIGALNVLLVLVIIVVAMKVTKKKEEPVIDSE